MSNEFNEFNVEQIKELIGALSQHKMKCLKIEKGDYNITIEGVGETVFVHSDAGMTAQVQSSAPAVEVSAPVPGAGGGNVVTSPMVGTFYSSPSPEDPPFVKVGQHVKSGDVLFIIEAMKLMNEVISQHDGIVTEIHAQNAQPVEYGQPVITIK